MGKAPQACAPVTPVKEVVDGSPVGASESEATCTPPSTSKGSEGSNGSGSHDNSGDGAAAEQAGSSGGDDLSSSDIPERVAALRRDAANLQARLRAARASAEVAQQGATDATGEDATGEDTTREVSLADPEDDHHSSIDSHVPDATTGSSIARASSAECRRGRCGREASPSPHRSLRRRAPSAGPTFGAAALEALSSDNLELERRKLARAVDKEHRWLRNILNVEVRRATTMAENHRHSLQETSLRKERMQAFAARKREASERRWRIDKEKRMQWERQQAQERQTSKRNFDAQCAELKRRQEAERLRHRQSCERQREEVERRRRQEAELAERRAEEWRQREARELRQLEREQQREERVLVQREMWEDEAEDLAVLLAARRQQAQEEAQRLLEERSRSVAEKARRQDEKMEMLRLEKQRLAEVRSTMQREGRRALEQVRSEIDRQQISSRFCPRAVQERADLLQHDFLSLVKEADLGIALDRVESEATANP